MTMPLYAIEWTRPKLDEDVVNPFADFYSLDFGAMNESELRRLLNGNKRPIANASDAVFTVTGRTAITIHTGRHASFCTYFNAFPASYWRRWTPVRSVRFTAQVKGAGALALMRSTGRGLLHPVETVPIDSPQAFTEVSVEMGMDGLLDGGFFWFDAKPPTLRRCISPTPVGRCLLPNGRMTCTHSRLRSPRSTDRRTACGSCVPSPPTPTYGHGSTRSTAPIRHRPCMRPTGLRRDGGRTRHAAHLHPAS